MSDKKLAASRLLRPVRSMSKGSNERWFEYYRTTCPICGKQGWCMVNDSETKIICGRIPSETEFGEAGYLHVVAEDQKRRYDFSQNQMIKEHSKKNDYTLDIIYTLFLEFLEVRDEHIKMLTGSKRRITSEVINIRNYKSFPIKPWDTTKGLIKKIGGKQAILLGFQDSMQKNQRMEDISRLQEGEILY